MRRSGLALMATVALVAPAALTACGAGGATTATKPSDARPSEATATNGAEILQFRAPLVGGGELDASTLAGQPVAFWFWAPT